MGAGPAGLYAAGHLLEGPGGTYIDGRLQTMTHRPVEVDVLDRLPTQWGLLRHGVAPDHPEKKLVQTVFEHISARRGFRFFGNIEVGKHVSVQELMLWYDAVIFAHGSEGDPDLGIPGETLPGCHAARRFVAWYNGHPDFRDLDIDLTHERAVIIGNGNVAMDVARILTTRVENLAVTDIADHALAALRASKIREILILGRRGRRHGAFNNPELEELGELTDVGIEVVGDEDGSSPDGLDLATSRKLATLREYSERSTGKHSKRIVLRFLTSPLEVVGEARVHGIRVARNRVVSNADGKVQIETGVDGEFIDAGLILSAIGFSGAALAGLPFDEMARVVPNDEGRVAGMPGAYVTGWIKRGPRGIIGTNKKCARDTVRSLLQDADDGLLASAGTLDGPSVEQILRERVSTLVDNNAWRRLDSLERQAGRSTHRPRVKLPWDDRQLVELRG
ncbi:FAD-dependent oxidoreductase [Nocardia asteroides]|uniref:FAD-dependent oxidoreductase n=1 Tax=Nocardia asteroides TaxID=1824 RepID=UPI0037C51549